MLLGHRIVLFKRGALETVFTIALIVAVLASLGAFVNQITARTRELKEFGNPSGGAIVFGENFEESSAFLQEIRASFEPKISENLVSASLPLDGEERGITVRAVDIRDFIKTRNGQLEGEIARENHEADVGEFLAEMADVEVGENIEVEVSGEEVELRIVGTVRTHGQSDVGLLVPRGSVLNEPRRVRMTVFEGAWEENADRINPPGGAGGNGQSRTKIAGTARVGRFIEETNSQRIPSDEHGPRHVVNPDKPQGNRQGRRDPHSARSEGCGPCTPDPEDADDEPCTGCGGEGVRSYR